MSFESFSRPSVDGDQGDRLLKQPSEAGDVEEGHPGRMQADSLASIYNTLRMRAKQQWQRRPPLEPIYQMYAMRAKKQWQKRPPLKSVYLMYAMIVLAMLLALLLLNRLGIGLRRNPWEPPSEVALWTKPEGFKIIGLVFFGRRATVEILDCYLKKNLVSNGGYLDEVLFISSKATEEDDAWLDQLLLTADEYHKAERRGMSFDNIWGSTVERGPMYIKLDDDLVCQVFSHFPPDADREVTGLSQRRCDTTTCLLQNETSGGFRHSCKPHQCRRTWLDALSHWRNTLLPSRDGDAIYEG